MYANCYSECLCDINIACVFCTGGTTLASRGISQSAFSYLERSKMELTFWGSLGQLLHYQSGISTLFNTLESLSSDATVIRENLLIWTPLAYKTIKYLSLSGHISHGVYSRVTDLWYGHACKNKP